MNAIFWNSYHSKAYDLYMLNLDLITDNTNLKRIHKFVALLILRILYRWKNI